MNLRLEEYGINPELEDKIFRAVGGVLGLTPCHAKSLMIQIFKDANFRGEPFGPFDDWADCMSKIMASGKDKATAERECGAMKHKYEESALVRTPDSSIVVSGDTARFESIPMGIGSFDWLKGKEYHIPPGYSGHLYAFRTLNVTVTHGSNNQDKPQHALWTEEEKRLSARSLIGEKVGLNHAYKPNPAENYCIDSEYAVFNGVGGIEGVLYVYDPIINRLYDDGAIVGVSVEYTPRMELCGTATCTLIGTKFTGIDMISEPFGLGDPTSKVKRMENEAIGMPDANTTSGVTVTRTEAETPKSTDNSGNASASGPPKGGNASESGTPGASAGGAANEAKLTEMAREINDLKAKVAGLEPKVAKVDGLEAGMATLAKGLGSSPAQAAGGVTLDGNQISQGGGQPQQAAPESKLLSELRKKREGERKLWG
jgi:hypothetical protein